MSWVEIQGSQGKGAGRPRGVLHQCLSAFIYNILGFQVRFLFAKKVMLLKLVWMPWPSLFLWSMSRIYDFFVLRADHPGPLSVRQLTTEGWR